jgi:hypothetical protein
LCGECARIEAWRTAQTISYGLGAGLALLALAMVLAGGSILRGTATAAGSEEPSAVDIRWIPVEVVKEVPVAEAEIRRAFGVAGQIRRQLAEWEERYRLPSGDFQTLVDRVDELVGLLQAAVYELRLLAEPEGVGRDD